MATGESMSAASSPPCDKFCQRFEGTVPWLLATSMTILAGVPAALLRMSMIFLVAAKDRGIEARMRVLIMRDFLVFTIYSIGKFLLSFLDKFG